MANPADETRSIDGVASHLFSDPLLLYLGKIALVLALLLIGVRVGRGLANLERRVLLLLSALELSGFPSATLLTVLGTAGIAIGLALKDSLSHIAAGVVLIVLRPFRVGDKVIIANQEGLIEGVYIFQTRLKAAENREIVLMNGAVIAAPIINYSQRALRRVELVLLLRGDGDMSQALAIARETAAADARIEHDPTPSTAIADISDRGVTLALQAWCKTGDVDAVRGDLLLRLHAAFAAHGVALAQAVPPPEPGKKP